MRGRSYLDTSFLVKTYIAERESEDVTGLSTSRLANYSSAGSLTWRLYRHSIEDCQGLKPRVHQRFTVSIESMAFTIKLPWTSKFTRSRSA